jgi:hypothetical protein
MTVAERNSLPGEWVKLCVQCAQLATSTVLAGPHLKDIGALAFPEHAPPFLDDLFAQVPTAPIAMTTHLDTHHGRQEGLWISRGTKSSHRLDHAHR